MERQANIDRPMHKNAHDPNYVRVQLQNAGYEMLSDYVNGKTPILFKCPKNHTHEITWRSFQQGQRCAICKKRYVSQNTVAAAFEAAGYTMLSEYVNARTPIRFRCSENHEHAVTWDNFRKGTRCGICRAAGRGLVASGKAFSRIVSAIDESIKLTERRWRDFYTNDQIWAVATSINAFYNSRPFGYHVDHIVPTSWFDLTQALELSACWSLENLRYLPALENIKRGNRMTQAELSFMMQNHPHIISAASRRAYA